MNYLKHYPISLMCLFLFVLFLILPASPVMAKAPQTINYQGFLTDSEGNPIDGVAQMVFSIYDQAVGGVFLWSETQNVTISDGLYNVNLGDQIPIALPFDQQYYLGIQVGTDAEMVPRVPFTSTPYAFASDNADQLDGQDAEDFALLDHQHAFSEMTGTATDSQVPDDITINYAASSGNADTVDNLHAAAFAGASHTHDAGDISTGTLSHGRFSAYNDLGAEGYLNNDSGSDLLTRSQADSRYSASGSSIEHSNLIGLDEDDHTQYVLADGSRKMTKLEIGTSTVSGGDIGAQYDVVAGDDLIGEDLNVSDKGTFGNKIEVTGTLAAAGGELTVYGDIDCQYLSVQGNETIGGNLWITGNIEKGSGTFKIDHPLDPLNKYLKHSFVESPDMMNIYNGNVMLDEEGEAWVQLPEWFQALNKDFRYQLTCIGGFAQVNIAEEIADNRFKIAGGTPGLKVSWQVTGIRQDPYAEANRIQVEEEKPDDEKGTYLHPEAYGKTD